MSATPRFLAVCSKPDAAKDAGLFSGTRRGRQPLPKVQVGCLGKRRKRGSRARSTGRRLHPFNPRGRAVSPNLHQPCPAKRSVVASHRFKKRHSICTTIIELETETTTELVETSERVSESTQARALRAYNSLVKLHEVVVVSGTKAAGYSDQIIPDMVFSARKQGCRVILDVHGADQ